MATYGIDLGTTYSTIATLDESGMPVIIENQNDVRFNLASAVYFPPDESSPPVVGEEAKHMAELEGDRVIQFIKRDIGKETGRTFQFGGIEFNPITISALILKRLAEYAGEQGHDVKDVVITCPAYFGTEERNATRQAGEIAGFNVLAIINESIAAAISYCAGEACQNRTIMVYDLGGSAFNVTILKMTVDSSGGANIDIIATDGTDRLGGKDWDEKLFQYLLKAYCNENGFDPADAEPELRQAIHSKVEDLKKKLTQNESKNVTISYSGNNTKIEVSREQFNDMTKDLVAHTIGFIDRVLSKSSLNESNIDVVFLVGGSTCMPMIQAAINALFPGKWRIEDPDLVVAKGAALYSAMLVPMRQTSGIAPAGGNQPQSARPALPTGISRKNYFELLTKLQFDPPEINSTKIKKEIDEIEKKTRERLAIETDPTARKKLEELINLLPDMKAVMDSKNLAYKAEAEAMKAIAVQELKTAIDLVLDYTEKSVTKGRINSFRRNFRLSEATVKKVFQDEGFKIEADKPLKLPDLLDSFMMDRINNDLEEVRNYKNKDGTNLQNINDLYWFTAYMNDDLPNGANYHSRSTKELKNILEDVIQNKNLQRRSDNIGHIFHHLCITGISFIFNNDENRKKYDNSLSYESLRELFYAINSVGGNRKDPAFANNCIAKIQKVFPDYDEALSIYNKERDKGSSGTETWEEET